LAQIAAEQEMQAFLELPLKNLKESPTAGDVGGVLAGLKPGNIFLAATQKTEARTDVLLGFQFWGARKDFDAAVARLRKELPDPQQEPAKETHNGLEILATRHADMTLYSAAAGRWGFLATSLDQLKTALDRAAGNSVEPSLKTNPRFVKVQAQLPADPEIMFFFEPEKAVDSILALGRTAGAKQIPSQVEELKSAEAIGGSLRFDGLLQRDALFVLRPSQPDSLPKLSHPALKLAGKDTTVFLDFVLNFAALPQLVDGIAESYPGVAALAKPIAEEAAATYGPECALVATWPDGNITPTPILAITAKDEDRSKDFLSQTIGIVPERCVETSKAEFLLHSDQLCPACRHSTRRVPALGNESADAHQCWNNESRGLLARCAGLQTGRTGFPVSQRSLLLHRHPHRLYAHL
jgi:hypothetical protein